MFIKALIVLMGTVVTVASAKDFVIIREHSKVSFEIDYMTMTKVEGVFKNFYGDFKFDELTREISNISVDVVAKSIDTRDEKRDFHLRGHEFFLVESYPVINFKTAGKVLLRADNTFSLPGNLTIRSISKPLTLQGLYKGKIKDAWGKDNYFFTLNGTMNRKDYGMTWNKLLDGGGFLIGDQVSINLIVQAQAQGEVTAFSTHMIPSTKGIVERDLLKRGKIKKLSTSTDPKDHEKQMRP